MEMMLIILIAVGIPGLALSGLVVGIASLVRGKRLSARLDAIEKGKSLEENRGIGPNHPMARRLRDLENRVEVLETSAPPEEPVEPAVTVEESVVEVPQPQPVAPPEPPPEPPSEQLPVAPVPLNVPEVPTPVATAAELPPAETPPPATPAKPPRARIDWERWIGVRGAAAAGGVVLALASLLFFQYSIEHGLISPTMRVVFGVIAGLCCLVGSQWLIKRDQAAAANALAGAGVVILYGATWAAQNLYGLIGTVPAFVLMVLITAVCVTLAVSRNAAFIAVLGLVGGFAAPLLVASEMDSPAALFGYILLLDLGLLWLARVRDWPLLSILSLAGTAVHQGIWIMASMDAERAFIGLLVLAIFGLAFLFFSGGERDQSRLWRLTRAGGVAIPFAFALHFAGTAELAENPWPLGLLLLILSAGACWLERRGSPGGAAVAAAGADLGIMGLWFLTHRISPAMAWHAVVLCLAMAALFTVAAEVSRKLDSARGLGLAAMVSALGFAAISAFSPTQNQVVQPWPWVAAWIGFGVLLVFHSRWSGRAWVQLAAGLAPAFGLMIAIDETGRRNGSPESWMWLALIVGTAVCFQVLAMSIRDEKRRLWAERTAAVTAIALMVATAVLSSVHRQEVSQNLGTILVLGVLATLAATRMKSGWWLLITTVATVFWQTAICLDAFPQQQYGAIFAVLVASAVVFTIWPALVPAVFRESRPAWWGGALAGPLWFPALAFTFIEIFGDEAIGLLPVALAAVALSAVLWVRPRLDPDSAGRRSAVVWYLAVVLSLVSLAIPLQLEKEWITIGWALNGLAILGLWVRLSHPGLKYFSLALLGAATVRLVANPEVLSYHLRVATPVLNWLTYTYLVPAAALVFSHRMLRPREVDRLTGWEDRLYPVRKPIWAACCGLAAVGVVFAWINLAIADVFATGEMLELSFQRLPARDATTSVAWAVYALVLLMIGVKSKSSSLRWLSLGILVLTLGKVFLHDLGELEDLYRVASLVGLAISFIVVSLIYQRFVFQTKSEDGE